MFRLVCKLLHKIAEGIDGEKRGKAVNDVTCQDFEWECQTIDRQIKRQFNVIKVRQWDRLTRVPNMSAIF